MLEAKMFKNIINKTLYDKRSFMIGWSLGVAVMAGITIAFFPTIKEQIGTLFANMPKALESITGSTEDYKNIVGYVGTGVFDLRIPMITVVMAIILALGLSVGEEYSGKIYQLLSQPISRNKIVWQKWLAMVIIFTVVHIVLALGILFIVMLINESMPISKLFIGTFMCYLLTLATGSITMLFGFGFGRKGLTTSLIAIYTFGSYLLTSFAKQIDWLKHVEPVSIFHYYKASEAMKFDYSIKNILVLIIISVLSMVLASLLFSKRDIGTHNV